MEEPTPALRIAVQWRLPLTSDRIGELDQRELGEPVLSPGGDLLVGGRNGWVYRLESHSGEVIWSTPVGGSIDAPATLGANRVYVGSDSGHLVSLDWRSGEEVWRFPTRGSVEAQPVVVDGRAFVTDSDEVLYALDALSGELLWDFQRQTPEFFTIKGGGIPLVVGSTLYIGFADGVLTALNVETGDEIWAIHLGDDTGEFGDIDVPLIHDGPRLIAASHAGGVFAVERATGALLWRQPVPNVVGLIREENWLFGATSGGRVFALNLGDGSPVWDFRMPETMVPMGISSTGRFLAVPVARGPMYWFRLRDGQPVLKWAPGAGFQNAPVFDQTHGYVLSNQGYLYGFRLAY